MEISGRALQLVEMIQSSPVLRPMIEARPELLTLFIRGAEIAVKMSTDRVRFIDSVNRAADASDQAIEAIETGDEIEVGRRFLIAAKEIEDLGKFMRELSLSAAEREISAASKATN